VLEGKALLQRLVKAFGIAEADVRETLSSVMDGAAKAALVQARASLRRGDPSESHTQNARLLQKMLRLALPGFSAAGPACSAAGGPELDEESWLYRKGFRLARSVGSKVCPSSSLLN
jgi:hypothetical protein